VEGQKQRSALRSFALGSLVGAAGAVAALRRARRTPRRLRAVPGGLAAFEDAPCFLEIVGGEGRTHREGGAEAGPKAPE
jgi:hypothetical protein